MDSFWIVFYYNAAATLCLGLITLAGLSFWPGFPAWLEKHPKVMLALLGINVLPLRPARTLKRFYLFLAGGLVWLLAWSWWLMPWLKRMFFHAVNSSRAYEYARISTLIVMAAYSALGFFCIGRAIFIWLKEIYNRPDLASGSEKP